MCEKAHRINDFLQIVWNKLRITCRDGSIDVEKIDNGRGLSVQNR